ncbi:MAG: hypothetical protein ABSE17_02300 [Candidatus Levyibacteriota bacterium]
MKCCQCDKKAIFTYDFGPLCVDCNFKFQQASEIRQSQDERMINYLKDVMYDTAGLPRTGARFPERRPPVLHTGPVNMQSVVLNNSVVGNINQGTVSSLNATLQNVTVANYTYAEQIKNFAESVARDGELSKETKDEVLQKLDFLAQQINQQQMNAPVIKTIISSITTAINISAGLATLWMALSPIFIR